MRSPLVSGLLVALMACAVTAAVASEKGTAAPADVTRAEPFVDVALVARWVAEGSATLYDANGAGTRTREGVVPGARLLPHYKDYDPARELPADKNARLVFYCHDQRCRAADGAAETARNAGYRNVSIMRAGIVGWVKAGHAAARPPKS